MANLKQKPNGIYYLDVQVPGPDGELVRQRISCETRDEAEAKAQRRDWLAGVHPKHPTVGGVVAPKGRAPQLNSSSSAKVRSTGVTVHQWLTQCLGTIWREGKIKGVRSAVSNVRVLQRLLPADLLLEDVTTDTIKELQHTMREQGYAEATVRKKVMALGAALTEAVAMDHTKGPPLLEQRPRFPKMDRPDNRQERTVNYLEEEAILAAIDDRIEKDPSRPWWEFRAFFILAIDMGWRAGEVLCLGPSRIKEKRWVDPVTGKAGSGVYLGVFGSETKSGKPRDVPCTDRVIALFPALNARATKGRWFPWKKDGSGLWYLWQNIKTDLDAKGFDLSAVKLHTFRHTCATRLAEGGMDLVSLRDWLGHSDIKVTADRYIHLMVSHLQRGADILNTCQSLQGVPFGSDNRTKGDSLNYSIDVGNRAGAGTPGHTQVLENA